MQAQVKKIRCDVIRLRPALARIGNYKRDVLSPQQVDKGRVEERLVANLDRVALVELRRYSVPRVPSCAHRALAPALMPPLCHAAACQ